MSERRILSVIFDTASGITRNALLAQAGYLVSPATSTTQAFELLEEIRFDLVIIGHAVPTAERRLLFLEIKRKWDIPVILVDSEAADPMIRARAHVSMDAGSQELLAAVATLLPQEKKSVAGKTPAAKPQPGC